WADAILEQFQLVDLFITDECELYGPYNTLLFNLFPYTEHFSVQRAKQLQDLSMLPPSTSSANESAPYFSLRSNPSLLLKLCLPVKSQTTTKFRSVSLADRNLILLKLYGISAMATRFSVYEYDEETKRLLSLPMLR
ncbi:hypothetical protein BJV74DRAFT_778533, partial [Russula compacta]